MHFDNDVVRPKFTFIESLRLAAWIACEPAGAALRTNHDDPCGGAGLEHAAQFGGARSDVALFRVAVNRTSGNPNLFGDVAKIFALPQKLIDDFAGAGDTANFANHACHSTRKKHQPRCQSEDWSREMPSWASVFGLANVAADDVCLSMIVSTEF